MMKQLYRLPLRLAGVLAMVFMLGLSITGCSQAEAKRPFEIRDIDIATLADMMENEDTFVLLVERDNCPFCAALNAYLDETKDSHEDLIVYKLDTTDYHLMREREGDLTLISDTEDGKAFLEIFPFFLYTPTLYQIKDGVPVQAALGYDDVQGSVSLWDVDSSINWQTAKPVSVWGYIKDGQGTAVQTPQDSESRNSDAAEAEETLQDAAADENAD